MSGGNGNFALLLDLAKETSSEKRRELLRKVTDVFLADETARTDSEAALFDEIFEKVATDMEAQVRAELAARVSVSQAPLKRLARRLAMDDIKVARHVLEKSGSLSDSDLIDVIRHKGQDHMMAVTRRLDINEPVSSALVEHGEDPVVASLLENRTARISRQTYEAVAERAQTSPALHAPFVRNQRVPLDLLNSVYMKVEAGLRREIMKKFHGVSPTDLEAALAASRNHLSSAYGALPADYESAHAFVADLETRGTLKPPILVQLLRENRNTAFTIAFAKLVDIEYALAQRLVDERDLDALAMLCRGAGFDRGLFVTLCIMISGESAGLAATEAFRDLYEQVPQTAAQRALRFWKVRAAANDPKAA
jgi:uncharacterized protein (DUF2336 family)